MKGEAGRPCVVEEPPMCALHDIVELPGGVSPQLPLGHGEPVDDVDWSEGRQLNVLVARWRRRWWRLGVPHLIVGCVVVSRMVK
jgi:hypothetical protein